MNSLDLFSVRALMQALEQIHSARELVALPEAFFSAVRGLVPAARFSIDQLDLKTGIVTSVTSEDRLFSEETKQRIIEVMPSHPVMPAVRPGARGAIRVTDCITRLQFRQTPHYIETLRPIDIQYQMVVTLDIPGKITGMTVNRDRNFTDKEAMLLHLAAPHIAVAHRNAHAFTTLKRVATQTVPTPEELRQVGITPRESEVLHWIIQGKRECRNWHNPIREPADDPKSRPKHPPKAQYRNTHCGLFGGD